MEYVEEFKEELHGLYSCKLPVSRAKIGTLTKLAMKAVKFYKHIVMIVEKFIIKSAPPYKLPSLYVIDSIVRQSKHQYNDTKEVYGPRFGNKLDKLFPHILDCTETDKPKVVRVLNLWLKNSVYSPEILQPLLDLAPPIPPPPQANADSPQEQPSSTQPVVTNDDVKKPTTTTTLVPSSSFSSSHGGEQLDELLLQQQDELQNLLKQSADTGQSDVLAALIDKAKKLQDLQSMQAQAMESKSPSIKDTTNSTVTDVVKSSSKPQMSQSSMVANEFSKALLDNFDYSSDEDGEGSDRRPAPALSNDTNDASAIIDQLEEQFKREKELAISNQFNSSRSTLPPHSPSAPPSSRPHMHSPLPPNLPPPPNWMPHPPHQAPPPHVRNWKGDDWSQSFPPPPSHHHPPAPPFPPSRHHSSGGRYPPSPPPPHRSRFSPPPRHRSPTHLPHERYRERSPLRYERGRPRMEMEGRGREFNERNRDFDGRDRSTEGRGFDGRDRDFERRGPDGRGRDDFESRDRDFDRRNRDDNDGRGRDFDRRSRDFDGRSRDSEESYHESRRRHSDRDRSRERGRRSTQSPSHGKSGHITVLSVTVWMGHLNKGLNQEQLSEKISQYGKVKTIDFISARGCAYVVMETRQDAVKVVEELKDDNLLGLKCKIAWAPGRGAKGKQYEPYWEVSSGISYIPHNLVKTKDDLKQLETGGHIDINTIPSHLKVEDMEIEEET